MSTAKFNVILKTIEKKEIGEDDILLFAFPSNVPMQVMNQFKQIISSRFPKFATNVLVVNDEVKVKVIKGKDAEKFREEEAAKPVVEDTPEEVKPE